MNRIDTEAAGEPLTLAVITATGYGYVREDGVAVIPIGALTARRDCLLMHFGR